MPYAPANTAPRQTIERDAPGGLYPAWTSWVLLAIMVAAVLIRLFYWHYTDRTWEDSLTAVLHSDNAARGLGLTHLQPAGQRPVQGFTSPLGVLVPLVADLIHLGWGLPFIKLVSCFCGAIAAWLGFRISQRLGLPVAFALTAAAYLAFEHQQILWGAAGMETQMATVAYLASLYALLCGSQWQKGLSLGLVMLARPDGAIWVAIALGFEFWRLRKTGSWRELFPVGAGLTLLYAPWLIFATVYYGSPIPNTIDAKEFGYNGFWPQFHGVARVDKPAWLWHRVLGILAALGPAYAGNGTGYVPLWDRYWIIATLMIFLCATGAVIAWRRRHVAALILYAFVITYSVYLYFCAPYIFGWYTVPVAAVAVIGSLYGAWQIAVRFIPAPRRGSVVAIAGVAYILAIVSILPWTFRSDKYIQKYIDGGVRKQVGMYLGRVSLPTDTIGVEPLGYVGYYSHRVIYDFPGLCSRNVIQFFRTHPNQRSLIGMMNGLRPTYLVLRPREYRDKNGKILYPFIQNDYELARVFKAPPDWWKNVLWPSMNIDYEFDVYRRKGCPYNSSPQPGQ